jgi:hypothetical protein
LVRRNASIVNTRFKRSAEYVTPHRMGGRVAPTKRTSAVTPTFLVLIGFALTLYVS